MTENGARPSQLARSIITHNIVYVMSAHITGSLCGASDLVVPKTAKTAPFNTRNTGGSVVAAFQLHGSNLILGNIRLASLKPSLTLFRVAYGRIKTALPGLRRDDLSPSMPPKHFSGLGVCTPVPRLALLCTIHSPLERRTLEARC